MIREKLKNYAQNVLFLSQYISGNKNCRKYIIFEKEKPPNKDTKKNFLTFQDEI